MEHFKTAYQNIYRYQKRSKVRYWFWGIIIGALAFLILPWTQNIRAMGKVTTLYQNQRPQSVDMVIGGKILKWYIKEGDYVKKGDTLIQIGEVKDEYFDTSLLDRTKNQITAKQLKESSYKLKASNYASSLPTLMQQRDFKISQLQNKQRQTQNKINADNAELKAASVELNIATSQLSRAEIMVANDVISKVDFENRSRTFQKANAAYTEKQNKLSISQRELQNIDIEIVTVGQEYAEKIFKAQAEQSGSTGEAANTSGEIEKLKIQLNNYKIRRDNYFIVAPQDGQVIKVKKAGINEIIKEGEKLLEVVPSIRDFAVELFIKPMDQVLVDTGQEVRFIFDGYPAIVFSGWPNSSYGTFTGKIATIETNSQEDGTFRVLVVPKEGTKAWPPSLKMGVAANAFAMLKDVPIGYELWRNINGFPPEYYKKKTTTNSDEKKK
jgi:multidrug efflux pump subunit AcrA (membrane-fusion protein)